MRHLLKWTIKVWFHYLFYSESSNFTSWETSHESHCNQVKFLVLQQSYKWAQVLSLHLVKQIAVYWPVLWMEKYVNKINNWLCQGSPLADRFQKGVLQGYYGSMLWSNVINSQVLFKHWCRYKLAFNSIRRFFSLTCSTMKEVVSSTSVTSGESRSNTPRSFSSSSSENGLSSCKSGRQ